MLFELTDDYQIILPLMLAVWISTLVSRQIDSESIYTRTLSRRGLNITQGVDMTMLDSIRVRDAMSTSADFVRLETPLGEIVSLLQKSDLTDFPVVDEAYRVHGIVSFRDIRGVIMENDLYRLLIAANVIESELPTINQNAPLSEALAMFAESDIYNLPVVQSLTNPVLQGVFTRSQLVRSYHQELVRRTA